ncbi:hypothetical protein Cgig2_013301 [Carnegiea gigantea]|uniref:Uncharacterized protein n=1 Tax=Carnegiea gigantea TaxID=171969 RepID=A0A9Q1GLP6_9CARY|nr:hypothetical protein Cgig2_013301 [Carnegiea gigantea]
MMISLPLFPVHLLSSSSKSTKLLDFRGEINGKTFLKSRILSNMDGKSMTHLILRPFAMAASRDPWPQFPTVVNHLLKYGTNLFQAVGRIMADPLFSFSIKILVIVAKAFIVYVAAFEKVIRGSSKHAPTESKAVLAVYREPIIASPQQQGSEGWMQILWGRTENDEVEQQLFELVCSGNARE